MNFRKVIVVTAMAVVVGSSGIIFPQQKAEAFNLSDIGGALGGLLGGKMVNIDIDGLSNQQNSMLQNLGNSAMLLESSSIDVMSALQLHPELVSQKQMALDNLRSDSTNLDFQRASVEGDIPSEDLRAAAKAVMDSGDQERIEALNSSIRMAENKRIAADICMALAAKDAVGIIKTAIVGIQQGNDVDSLQNLLSTAQAAKSIIDAQNHNIKTLNSALREYKAKQNIKAPKKSDVDVSAALAGLQQE